ncbi:uncharacterized protein [Antedon mediterranea]|uniref:uncharacterized protein n=1 Tax=Antedon mediterranea TaxID=105859 RepID=UPI003AF97646
METTAVFFLFLFSFINKSFANLIHQPEDTIAEVGDTVVLRCSVDPGPEVNVYWQLLTADAVVYLTDNTRVYPGSESNTLNDRLTIVGDDKTGVFDLRIKPIYGSDSGKFLCLYFVDGLHQKSSRVATLTVLSPPFEEYPICSLTPKNNLQIGDFIRMTCVTSGGIPPARIYWKRFEEMLPAYLHEQDGRIYISYEFTLSELDNGAVFTCEAVSPAIRSPRFCSVRPYRNETKVRIHSRSKLIIGNDGIFDCIASAIPPADIFEWRINNNIVDVKDGRLHLENYNQTLRISSLNISDKNNEISCVAGNTYVVVTGNASMSLSISKVASVNGPEIVGICIGIFLVIISAVILLYFLLKYKKKRDFFKDLDFDKACRNSYVFPRQFFSRRSQNECMNRKDTAPENDRRQSRVIVCSTPQEAINIHSTELQRIPENQSPNPRYSVGFYSTNATVSNHNESRLYNEVLGDKDDEIQEDIYANIDDEDNPKATPPKPPSQSLKPRISGPILNYSTNNSVDLANAMYVGIID